MTTTEDRIRAIEALLSEAESAHGVYETTVLNGVYDQEWAAWYASYAVEYGLGDLVGRAVSADELAGLLATTFAEFKDADPKSAEPWAAWMARRIAAEL